VRPKSLHPLHCDEESISHLFVFCPYAGQVAKLVKEKLNVRSDWNKESLEECYQLWVQDRVVKLYSGLPSIMISNIWWAHNSTIFKDKWIPLEVIATITLNQAVDFKDDPKEFKQRILFSPP
jgi:hypothetical protein